MFQLLMSVMSLALVSATALIGMHYAGNAYSGAMTSIDALSLLNEGQQIEASVILNSTDQVGGQLALAEQSRMPTPPRVALPGSAWQIDQAGVAYIPLNSSYVATLCPQIATKGGINIESSWNGASDAIAQLDRSSAVFGCVGNPSDRAGVFFTYRL